MLWTPLPQSLDKSISNLRDVLFDFLLFSFFYCISDISLFNVNSVYPDQMPHSEVTDLSLHC